jgi:hypothetical protein
MGLLSEWLKDEEFLVAAGLLTAGAEGKTIGQAAFPAILGAAKIKKAFGDTAKSTKSVWSIKDNKNVLATDKEISENKSNYLPAAKKDSISPNDLGVMVWNKLKNYKGEEFDNALANLPQAEIDIYNKIIKGNEDWFNTLIKDQIKDNKSITKFDSSKYSLTETGQAHGNVDNLIKSVMASPENKDLSLDEIIEFLIKEKYIKVN